VAAAAQASHPRESLFHVESAELLQQRHAKTPFTRLLTDSSAAVAATAGGTAVVLLPLDWVRWTAAAEETVREIDARARKELKATRVDVLLDRKGLQPRRKGTGGRGWRVISP